MFFSSFWLRNLFHDFVEFCFRVQDLGQMSPIRERARRSLARTVDYIEKAMPGAIGLYSQRDLLKFALARVSLEGHFLEFGVYKGGSISYMARARCNQIFHGFDSFEGLPEDWSGNNLSQQAFNLGGELPSVPSNVHLHRGLFDASLPVWLKENAGNLAFLHIDCDLYSSTATVFELLAPRIVPGCVVLFDEYFNYPNWEDHEYRAFQEFVKKHNVSYSYLAFSRYQVLVKINKIGRS